ncbi:MAG: alkaline phosphatase D family protein [Alphaproteobacteria bacterium]|nr:alkaline phosphatase D family protein [Alphaproteobacteria bacterium]
MSHLTRRNFVGAALAIGAQLAWSNGRAAPSGAAWRERRDLFPEGVASGDPHPDSVILWTRRPFESGSSGSLLVEVSEDEAFTRVVTKSTAKVFADADWTCRVLAAGLKPAQEYWYRFSDDDGNGSRVGRTITAPSPDDPRPVRFAFVSCQSVNEGVQLAYRRMIWEDRRAAPRDRLGFVLHLGDFIYEVVEYADEVKTRYDRTIFDIGRIPDSRKVSNFHVPTTLEGYRVVYKAHLHDRDIQDARARFPFVCIWDNHEFSWQGWQSNVKFGKTVENAQPLKVAANQAWFEFIPARIERPSGTSLERFDGPHVVKAPIQKFDDDGLGIEPNNLTAINSLKAYRALRYGNNVELIITDMRSYRMQDQIGRPEADPLTAEVDFYPQDAMEIIDAGRSYKGGNPPAEIVFGNVRVPNFRKDAAPFTILGKTQREWFKRALSDSKAKWKVWGASMGTLDWRLDPQNLPPGMGAWPSKSYGSLASGDFGSAYSERGEIYDHIRREGITGFATVSGDRHSFWAGYAAKSLPPEPFEPVGVAFITGSISAPGSVEAWEHSFPKDHPLRPIHLADRPGRDRPEATINLTMHHGVRSAIEYAKTGDIAAARALRNPDVAPHLEFIDLGGHGYAVVTAGTDSLETEFVCIPRPIAPTQAADGGPLRYRVKHRAKLWRQGEAPKLIQTVLEGDARLSV